MTELSIVVVSHDCRERLLGCLQSVLRAAEALALEVLVIDNGSQDGSADAVRSQFPQVQLIRNEGNLGFSRGCNQGLRRAGGRHLLLLSPTVEIDPGALAAMTSFLESTPAAGAVGAQLMDRDGRARRSAAVFPNLRTELTQGTFLARLFAKGHAPADTGALGPTEVDALKGACMMTRREILQAVGYLDEGYFLDLAETEWCLRVRRKGRQILLLPHVRVRHHPEKVPSLNPAISLMDYYRSRYRYFTQHHSGREAALLRVGLFVKLCLQCTHSLLMVLGTLFLNRRERERLKLRGSLLAWHLTGCPEPQIDPAR